MTSKTTERIFLALRDKQLRTILTATFANSFGAFFVTPFLVIYLSQIPGIEIWAIGLALTLKITSQNALMILGGWTSDRFGPIAVMVASFLIRAVAYLQFASADSNVRVIGAALSLGVGAALFMPSSKSAILRITDGRLPASETFAIRSAVSNMGAAIGPIAGGILLISNPRAGLVAVAAAFLLLAPILWRIRAGVRSERESTVADAIVPPIKQSNHGSGVIWLFAASALFGASYSQIEFAIPVVVAARFGEFVVGLVFATNAVIVVLTQLPLVALTKALSLRCIVASGGLLMAVAFAVVADASGWALLLLAITFFTTAEVILDPRIDAGVELISNQQSQGRVFGLLGIGFAIGAAAANAFASTASEGNFEFGYWLRLSAVVCVFAFVLYLTQPRSLRAA